MENGALLSGFLPQCQWPRTGEEPGFRKMVSRFQVGHALDLSQTAWPGLYQGPCSGEYAYSFPTGHLLIMAGDRTGQEAVTLETLTLINTNREAELGRCVGDKACAVPAR